MPSGASHIRLTVLRIRGCALHIRPAAPRMCEFHHRMRSSDSDLEAGTLAVDLQDKPSPDE
jgi:hypothetical protein